MFILNQRVKGTWRGWRGDTVVELSDGSVWQQDDFHRELAVELNPEVILDVSSRIARTGRMSVGRSDKFVKVKRFP